SHDTATHRTYTLSLHDALPISSPVASAQVKSALLFAALTGQVPVTIREPYHSRDHTERLFAHLGLGIHERDGAIVFEPSHRSTIDRKSTRLNSSHLGISYAVFC